MLNLFDVIINVNVLLNNMSSNNKPVDKIFQFEISSLLVKQSECSRTTYSATQFYIPK